MCGISGILTNSYDSNDEAIVLSKLKLMTDLISHRGPDGFGYFQDKNVNFGHRRLSILDISEAGTQPMSYLNKYTITYNGEVYNYLELKEILRKDGYSFQSDSDTEVILAAYDKWGVDCVTHFNGMWAFAIFDKGENTVFCSRDRFGVKPFYYTIVDDFGFIFGSEIKQLLSFTEKRTANIKIVLAYLVQNITNYSEETFFNNILELRGGHNLIYDLTSKQFSINKYYEIAIDNNVAKYGEEEALRYFEKEFERSVAWRLRSDVKVGTCLSGGLDSSSIAAFANKLNKQQSGERFCSITAKSTEKEMDESYYAESVGKHLNLEQYFTEPTIDDFKENIDELIYTQEEPFVGPTVFMQYFVMKKSREKGIIVLLDGQGADEGLLGYLRYIPVFLSKQPWYKKIAGYIEVKRNYGISIASILKNQYYFTSPILRKYYQINRMPKIRKSVKSKLDFSLIQNHAEAFKDIHSLQKMEITKTQVPQLLRFEDKNSMRHGVETRLPFLDWNFVEMAISINYNLKLHDGWSKYILRKTVENKLPDEIVWRKLKMNFNAPINEWMSDRTFFFNAINKSNILRDIFEKEISSTKVKDMTLIWRLYNVAKWEEIYKVESE